MPDEIRVTRSPQTQPQQRPDMSMQQEPSTQKSSKMPWIVLGVVVVIIIVLAVLFRGKLFKGSTAMTASSETMAGASGYQAVFLTNGQVYFGKLTSPDADYLTLDDIYYLQVVQPPLQGSQQTQAQTQTQPQISLVKLGNELHGPVDEMHINRSQVLFYEDLKSDGQVVKAIEASKASSATPAPTK